jgi:hypothetical protein
MLLRLLKLCAPKCVPGGFWCYEWCWLEAFLLLWCYSVSQRVSGSGETSRRNAESRTGDRSPLLLPLVGTIVNSWRRLPFVYCGLVKVKGKLYQCLLSIAPWRHIESRGRITAHFERNFMPGVSCPRTQWIGGWLGHTADLDHLECKTKPLRLIHLALLIVTLRAVLS